MVELQFANRHVLLLEIHGNYSMNRDFLTFHGRECEEKSVRDEILEFGFVSENIVEILGQIIRGHIELVPALWMHIVLIDGERHRFGMNGSPKEIKAAHVAHRGKAFRIGAFIRMPVNLAYSHHRALGYSGIRQGQIMYNPH